MMRIAFALSLFFVSCTTALAQKGYFLFIQSEGRQPFYVRLGDRTFSSTAGGHVIIPELRDSSYRVTVGFPRNQFPEQQYSVMFNQSDLALDLKKAAGGSEWKLYNTQTSEWLPARQDLTGAQEQVWGERKKDNGFAALMAAVVNDSSVLYTTVVRAPVVPPKQEAPKQEAVVIKTDTATASPVTAAVNQEVKQVPAGMPAAPVDSAVKVTGAALDSAVVNSPVAPTDSNVVTTKGADSAAGVAGGITKPVASAGKPVIARVGELTEEKGKKIIYTDSTANGVDTIALVIDFEKDTALMASQKQSVETALKDQVAGLDIVPAKPVDSLAKKTDTALAAGLTPGVTDKKDTLTKAAVTVPDSRKDAIKDSVATSIQVPAVAEVKKDTAAERKEGIVAKKEDPGVKNGEPVVVKTDPPAEGKKEAVGEVKKEAVKKENETTKEVPVPVKQEPGKQGAVKQEVAKQEPLKTDAQIQPDTTSVKKSTPNVTAGTSTKKLVMFNSDCQMVASEQDVDKLRVRIMAETNIDGRLGASKKFYRSKCLITRQVKALSELFMNDEEKYRFFETSYPHVYDTANYKQLLNLLTEEPYIGRFKTLIKI